MQVAIKKLNVPMQVKSKGVEFEVRDTKMNGHKHLGDLVLSNSKLIWCPGKTLPANGKAITWKDFIEFMNTR